MNRMHIGQKELKLPLFTDDMIMDRSFLGIYKNTTRINKQLYQGFRIPGQYTKMNVNSIY